MVQSTMQYKKCGLTHIFFIVPAEAFDMVPVPTKEVMEW